MKMAKEDKQGVSFIMNAAHIDLKTGKIYGCKNARKALSDRKRII